MKYLEAEKLNAALQDQGVLFKFLSVPDYMKGMDLIKKISIYLSDIAEKINTLIKEYNKEFVDKTKTDTYKKAIEKKTTDKELTSEEKELLDLRPAVDIRNHVLSGPTDFIDKVNAFREIELDLKNDLNFVSDQKIFKAMVENASPQNQAILFEYLFKNETKKKPSK